MIHVGTSGFQYPEWKGKFYPADLPAARMLGFYADHFSTTESNYTFRRIPSATTLDRWAEGTPPHFRFSLKAPQRITHFAKLKNCEDTLRFFCETARRLGPKLGVILFQLPPAFARDVPVLQAFLNELPPGLRTAFEFRHVSWFDDEVFAVLRRANAALCIARSENLVTPAVATADYGYLRLRAADYSDNDIAYWAHLIGEHPEWQEVFIYFKHEEAGTGPLFAKRLLEALKQAAPGEGTQPTTSAKPL